MKDQAKCFIEQRWYPVDEALPPRDPGFDGMFAEDSWDSIDVLLFTDAGQIFFGYYRDFGSEEAIFYRPKWFQVGRSSHDVPGRVTHWRPLPEPPEA